MKLIYSSTIQFIWQKLILLVVLIFGISLFWMPTTLASSTVNEIKVSLGNGD
jgi:hypothetical protein